ncbi:MAG: tyrosine-type recombinase/integrase, partial [Novosphingobium sp.]
MPKPSKDHLGRIGSYWLSKRPGSDQWCRTWFDPDTRQTRRASLGTDDPGAARVALARWVTMNVALRQQHPRDVALATVFARYYQQHGSTTRSAGINRRNLYLMLTALPEGMTVGELTLDQQHRASAKMHETHGAGTVKRCFAIARAAVNWAWKNGELDRPVPFLAIREGAGRERILSIEELARLWSTDMPDHVRVYLALLIGTAARPEAVLELTRFQCDVERGTINLNPPGRVQTKKRRPQLPMASWLRPWIEAAQGPLVAYRGRPVRKIAGAFQTLRDAAGFGPDVTSYTIRHTIATEMAARGVPELEIAAIMGHRMPNSRTTGRYLHVAPERFASARMALEDIGNEIGRAGTRPISVVSLRAISVSVAFSPGGNPTEKPLLSGAGEGIRTLDPNLGKV